MLRRSLALAWCVAVLAAATPTSVMAGPAGPQASGGVCTGVKLRLHVTDASVLRLTSDSSGQCTEFNDTVIGFVTTGPLRLESTPGTIVCTGGGSSLTADMTFHSAWPLGTWASPVEITLDRAPGSDVVAVTLRSKNLPPELVGSGAFVAKSAPSCSAASWEVGQILFEDPRWESP